MGDRKKSSAVFGSTFHQWFIGYFLVALIVFACKQCRIEQKAAAERERKSEALHEEILGRPELRDALNEIYGGDGKSQ